MDIQTCMTDFKLIANTQVDLNYFNSIAPLVFKNPSEYASVQSNIQFINQIGGTIFNYFNQKDPASQKIWYQALGAGLGTAVADATKMIAVIPTDTQSGSDLISVLQEFISDCQAIQKIIPVTEDK